MKYLHSLTAMLLLSASSNSVLAQDSNDVIETNITDTLIPIEIMGIRANHLTPFTFNNLYQYEFKKYQTGQDIAYTLQALPSIVSNSDAGNGVGYTDIRVRGTDMQRINFTLNGIPLNDAESQGTFFVNTPDLLSSTQSIQIQRGVGSSTNGPGSFGGSINISNIHSPSSPFIETQHSIGSFNTFKNSIHVGTGVLKNGFYSTLRVSKITSDGYIERSSSDLSSLHWMTGWSSEDNRTSIKFNLLLGKEKTGQAWNGVSEEMLEENRRFNELGIKEDGTYYEDQTDNYQQHYYQLFIQHEFNENWSANIGLFMTRGLGFYNEYRIGERYSTYYLPDFTIDSTTISETSLIRQLWLDNYYYGSVFNLQYTKNKTMLNLGGSISRFDNEHYGIVKWASQGIPADYQWYHNPADKSDYNIYAKWTQQLRPKFYSYLDLQIRGVEYNIYGYRKSPDIVQNNSYFFFNPKAGLTYINNHQKAFLSFGIANKEPNRDDFEASSEQTPSHETLYDWELGYEWSQQRYQFAIQLYNMQYKNQLVNTGKINDVGAYTRMNVNKSYRRGVELSGKFHLHEQISLSAHATFSQNKIKDFIEYIDDYDNGGQVEKFYKSTDISLSPNIIAFVQLSTRPISSLPHLQWDINGRYISRQYLDNTSSISKSIDPYLLFNTILQYEFDIKNSANFTVGLSIQNILDTKYSSKGYTFSYIWDGMNTYNYYYPQAGRQYYLTLNMRL